MGNEKVSWLWKQVEDARAAKDTEKARESLERLLEDRSIRGTPITTWHPWNCPDWTSKQGE